MKAKKVKLENPNADGKGHVDGEADSLPSSRRLGRNERGYEETQG